MSVALDFQDPRLNAVVGPLQSGNYKKALQEVNKVLKKTPSCATAKILKAFVLNRSGKVSEGTALAEEVINTCPTDEATITAIICYLRKTDQVQRISDYLKSALVKCPNREDLLVYLFLHHVQEQDYSSQQATARLLSQHFTNGPYAFWMIMSTLMQGESDPVMGEKMFFPLAERLLLREIENGKVIRHGELKLFVDLLVRLKKYEEALKVFDRKELIAFIDSGDYACDYSRDIFEINVHLKNWDECFHLASVSLKKDPNDWLIWKSLIEMATTVKDTDDLPIRVERLSNLISDSINDNPHLRGPQLARLDLCAVLNKHGHEKLSVQHEHLSYLKEYFDNFSPKPICSLDIAYILPHVLTDKMDRHNFIKSLVDQYEAGSDTVTTDDKVINRHVCTYQIARANGYSLSLVKLLHMYFLYAPERRKTTEIISDQNKPLNSSDVSDPYPVDDFLLIALPHLMEQNISSKLPPNSKVLASSLLATHWIRCAGLQHTPFNHHLRLKLCKLYSPTVLNCVDLTLPQLNQLDIKRLLLISLGYLSVSPTPTLALWGESQPVAQQSENAVSVINHYQLIRSLWDAVISETEEFLVIAYRRNTYTKIQEFTAFLNTVRHADVFVTVSLELLHWQLTTSVNDFDVLLEHLGSTDVELNMVSTRLKYITDCRDLAVTPEFNPIPCQEQEFSERSWSDLKTWLELRCTILSMLQLNTKLVMRIVCAEDKLIMKPDLSESADLNSSKQDYEISAKLTEKLDFMKSLSGYCRPPAKGSVQNFSELTFNLLTKPEKLFVSPVSTPDISTASLYLYGPYHLIMALGTRLLIGIQDVLSNDEASSFTEEIEQSIFTDFNNIFSSSSTTPIINRCLEDLIEINWLEIPSPSVCENPAGLLIVFGFLYECISLINILLSMIRSALRPRSHIHSQTSKKTKRKGAKSGKNAYPEGAADESVDSSRNLILFSRLDQLGCRLLKLVTHMASLTLSLARNVDCWFEWSTKSAAADMTNLAIDFCMDVLPSEFLDQNPVLKPTTSSPIFAEISSSYSKCFDHIASGLRSKAENFKHMSSELGVYECINKLSACTTQSPVTNGTKTT